MDDLAAALELARRDPRRQLGRFLVLSELGRGGMGVVYRAWDPAAERAVALKVLLEDDPAARARFRREGDAVARLQHPGIVRVHEQGELAGRPFVVMELVEGRSLDKAPVPLPVDAAVALARALCDALTHAHERGVVHRDLKPANVIVGPDGRPRVLDFGLAQLLDRSRLTKSGTLLGTASYMAPEQLDGRADARSDVYSLGATLYWLLTGRPPFQGETVHNVLAALAHKDVDPPSSSNAAVSAALDGVLLRCLEKDPAARYPSATAFGGALERALRGERVEPARRDLLVPAALAGAVLLAAGAGGWWAARSERTDPAGPSTAVAVVDPRAALDEATAALASGDPHAALAAITSARAAGATPRLQQRAAALEGEARWLLGELDLEASLQASDAEGKLLLGALRAATHPAPSSAARRVPTRPAESFARAIERGRSGLAAEAAAALDLAGEADATPLAAALLRAGDAAAVRWLLPNVDARRLTAADAVALAHAAQALLERDPEGARALATAAKVVGPLADPALLGELSRRALGRAEALADKALFDGFADQAAAGSSYREALRPFKVALAVDPTAAPPPALRSLLLQLTRQVPADPRELHVVEQSENAKVAATSEGAAYRLTVAQALENLGALRDRAASPASRRQVAYVASELLVHAGRAPEACDWLAAAAEGGLGPDDHDFVVQWVRVLHATQDPRRREQARSLLDRVLEDDPLHGDAREARGRLLLDLGVDLEQAAHDLRMAGFDYQRGRTSTQHPRRDPFGFLAAVEEARGDLDAAWAACEKVPAQLRDDGWHTEVRNRVQEKLAARDRAR